MPLVKKSEKSSIEIVPMVTMGLLLLIAVVWAVLDGYQLATNQLGQNHIPFLAPCAMIAIDGMAAWVELH